MLFLLAACGDNDGSGPGGVSEGEARALDEAAEMLDARRLPDEAIPALNDAPVETDGDGDTDGSIPSNVAGDNAP